MASGARPALALLGMAGVLAVSCFIGFGLWFAPGWANGWPFGLHRKVVWPIGLSCVVLLTVFALSALLGTALHDQARPPDSVRYRWWLWCGLGTATSAAAVAFLGLRSQAVTIWP